MSTLCVGNVVPNSKEVGGISLNKFEISRVANESLFKLGMGEGGVATT